MLQYKCNNDTLFTSSLLGSKEMTFGCFSFLYMNGVFKVLSYVLLVYHVFSYIKFIQILIIIRQPTDGCATRVIFFSEKIMGVTKIHLDVT